MAGVGMYICHKCGAVFDEPNIRIEREMHSEFLPEIVWEDLHFPICPECGGNDFDEAALCEYCMNEFDADDLIGGTLCKGCLDEILRGRGDLVRAYIMGDPEAFVEYLNGNPELKPTGGTEE